AEKLDGTLGLYRNWMSEEQFAEIEKDLVASRGAHDVAVRAAAARIRSTIARAVLEDTVVSLLIDHSGSMRGENMLLAARAGVVASDFLDGLGAKQEVLGFTTVRWKGGRSREKWLRSGRPPYPGRLNDLLHIVYCSAGERLHARHFAMMLREGALKAHLDSEAVGADASRQRERGEGRKDRIPGSHGPPGG